VYQYILPAISIFGFGLFWRSILTRFIIISASSKLDIYLESFLFGTLSTTLLLIVFGGLGYFIETSLTIYTIGLFSLLVGLLRMNKKTLNLQFFKRWNIYQWALFGILLVYFIDAMISPLRGWDALQFYLPNARIYVLDNRFTLGTNPLTFYPMFKPPLTSILFGYSFAVVGEFHLQVFPLFYMSLIPYVCIKIANLLFEDQRIGYFAAILLSTMTFSFQILLEFYYYQEIFLTLFVNTSFYYYLKFRASGDRYHLILAMVSIVLSALAKLSGIIVFPFMALIFREFIHRYFSAFGVFLATLFLTYKAAVDIYIGTALVVFGIGMYIIWSLIRHEDNLPQLELKDQLIFLSPGIAGSILGFIGFAFLAFTSGSLDFWARYIFKGKSSSIQWYFPEVKMPESTIWFEYTAQSSFYAAIFFLFTGMIFVSGWMFYKIWGMWKMEMIYPFLNRWIWMFFIIWLTYFSANSSSRYLSFILIPISIVTSKGMLEFARVVKIITRWEFNDSVVIWFNGILPFFYHYPTVPFEYVLETHALRLYHHHLYQYKLLLYAIAFFLIGIALLKLADRLRTQRYQKILAILMVFMVLLPTILAYMVSDFSTEKIQTGLFHHTRTEMNMIVDYLNSQGMSKDDLIMTIDTPGLAFRTGVPSYDLMMPILDASIFDGIDPGNANTLLQTWKVNNLKFFLYPRAGQLRYEFLDNRYGLSNVLSEPVFNDRIFKPVFNTSDYTIFSYSYSSPLIGLLSMGITDGLSNISLMGENGVDRVLSSDSQLMFHFTGTDIMVSGSLPREIKINLGVDSYNFTVTEESDLFVRLPILGTHPATWSSISIQYVYGNTAVNVDELHSDSLLSVSGDSVLVGRGFGITHTP